MYYNHKFILFVDKYNKKNITILVNFDKFEYYHQNNIIDSFILQKYYIINHSDKFYFHQVRLRRNYFDYNTIFQKNM